MINIEFILNKLNNFDKFKGNKKKIKPKKVKIWPCIEKKGCILNKMNEK